MKNIDISRFSTAFEVRRLDRENGEEILELMQGNPLFYKNTDRECSMEQIYSDLEMLPPGKRPEEKYYLGFYSYDYLMAVLDFVDGYPDADTAYIGFFMLDKFEQGRRLAAAMVERVCICCAELGYKRVKLAWDKENFIASRFWQQCGFVPVEESEQGERCYVSARRELPEDKSPDFASLLLEQARLHPSMGPTDALKLCYQAAHGAEHGISDHAAARKYLREELKGVDTSRPCRLWEQISPELCRVNLGEWKKREMKWQWLYNMFIRSEGSGDIAPLLDTVASLAEAGALPFTWEEWKARLDIWDGGAVSHSEAYRAAEEPHYRIVPMKYVNAMRVMEKMAEYPEGCVVAIDGMSNSGKSTLGEALAEITEAGLVHMDDFCTPAGRSQVLSLGLPGGNLHYSMFKESVLPHIRSPKAFSHPTYDCARVRIGKNKRVRASAYRIVEGSYSQHSYFGEYMDIKVFMRTSRNEQRRRVVGREGERMAGSYFGIWIPQENEYFDFFRTDEKADVLIET